jgi:L-2,4-diaminobutyric acid acetyltransferase
MPHAPGYDLRRPTIADGGAMWRLAQAAGHLDVNSSYAYLLWCRDFAATSVVAHTAGPDPELGGFITGYRRPDDADVLLVWQVAVSPSHRRRGLAMAMLDHLVGDLARYEGRWIETTVTPDNEASRAMFTNLAARHGVVCDERVLFERGAFPDEHEPEHLLRLGPFAVG